MQVSLNWLSEYVDIKGLTPDSIASGLTLSGLEVENIEYTGPKFENIKIAKIIEINNHPNADKLHLVSVDVGSDVKTVVCGAKNIEVGQIIPYASIGSKVFSRKTGEAFELVKTTIRGVESVGMLCSADELGLDNFNYQEEDGILILNRFLNNFNLGDDLAKVLDIKEDVILHTAPTANRGDEMSIIGIAREISAIFNRKFNFSILENQNEIKNINFKVEILDDNICKYYAIGVLNDIKIEPSPKFIQERLISSGVRPINNIVDITNYVMLEYGQPLHAFDMDKLNGYLCVRKACENEKIITLDGIERILTKDSVVIATKDKPVCIAGVFGGKNSEIDENTKNIALEAAYFTPSTNRKNAKSIGYRSEASARFERGVDLYSCKNALFRAIFLILQHTNAKFEGIVEDKKYNDKLNQITLRFNEVKRILGCEIESGRCIQILDKLGFKLLGSNETAAKFEVPGFRKDDVYREIDLIEEISRINGYDKITPTLPANYNMIDINIEQKYISKINNIFLGNGFFEAKSSSLIGQTLLEEYSFPYNFEQSVNVINAQSEDFSLLRQSLLPNALNYLKYNLKNSQKNIMLYEIGKVYFKTNNEPTELDSSVSEKQMLSFIISGRLEKSLWYGEEYANYYSLKGIIENIFEVFKIQNRIRYEKCNESYLHPSKSAKIVLLDKKPQVIGYFGELHPLIKDKAKFINKVYLGELNLDLILKTLPETSSCNIKYKKISVYPISERDIAFIIDKKIPSDEIIKNINKYLKKDIINSVNIFDVYQGENIDKNMKSVAFNIKFQSIDGTLNDNIINDQINNLKQKLKDVYPMLQYRE